MKKLAYITLIAAFVFGMQPQEAFSTENTATEMAAAETGEVKIGYDERQEALIVSMRTSGDRERAVVYIMNNRKTVLKEVFLVEERTREFTIDLAGLPEGGYYVKVVAPSFREGFRFKKK